MLKQEKPWLKQVCTRPREVTVFSACSGDMLLEALVACAGVTLRAVSTAIGVKLNGATGER